VDGLFRFPRLPWGLGVSLLMRGGYPPSFVFPAYRRKEDSSGSLTFAALVRSLAGLALSAGDVSPIYRAGVSLPAGGDAVKPVAPDRGCSLSRAFRSSLFLWTTSRQGHSAVASSQAGGPLPRFLPTS
jgi:hypothetical protein